MFTSLEGGDDLGAEPDLPGVRFPQAKFTRGWQCSLDAGPWGGNTECAANPPGYPNDIGDSGRGIPDTTCPTMQYCLS
eukprot:CAMPEP_0184308026 /NCGR_PEP_ID=MMETSP1049-20130417/16602_1 /TAXON_ID=77928 /ORGANISM="Proteomonas sulcata, Strain CCMP704" /LENGTH=77 /DNA_ID=CAMNT_0026620641 /DNA_START=187 /DNA_END=420 /DNA_ORIENTATION=+